MEEQCTATTAWHLLSVDHSGTNSMPKLIPFHSQILEVVSECGQVKVHMLTTPVQKGPMVKGSHGRHYYSK